MAIMEKKSHQQGLPASAIIDASRPQKGNKFPFGGAAASCLPWASRLFLWLLRPHVSVDRLDVYALKK